MNSNTMSKLLWIATCVMAAVAFYYVVSPYQNCVRDTYTGNNTKNGVAAWCARETNW